MSRFERISAYSLGMMYFGPTLAMVIWASASQSARSIITIPLAFVLLAFLIGG